MKDFEPEGFDQASPQEKKDILARFGDLMKDYQDLIAVLDDTQKKVTQQAEEISQFEDANQRLTNELADKEAVIRHLEARAQSQTAREDTPVSGVENRAQKQQRIENPDKFTGKKEPISFDQWRTQIKAKLTIDEYLFDTEQRKVQYVASRTEGLAYDYIWEKLEEGSFRTGLEVIETLAQVFDDPNKKQNARVQLAKLHQGEWTFHRFLNAFVQTIRPLKLSDEDKKEEMAPRLNPKYLNAIVGDIHTSTFDQLVAKLHIIDKGFESAKAAEKIRQGLFNSSSGQTSAPGHRGSNPTTQDRGNSDRAEPQDRRVFRTDEQKQILREQRLCNKCCKPGHILFNCPDRHYTLFPSHLTSTKAEPKVSGILHQSQSPDLGSLDQSEN
jgi:hypothetical protein